MKVKANELTGTALDWAVAKVAEVDVLRCGAGPSQYLTYVPKGKRTHREWQPSTNWKQGGPLVEKYLDEAHREVGQFWVASATHASTDETFLVAGLRCVVGTVLGPDVDIPERLLP